MLLPLPWSAVEHCDSRPGHARFLVGDRVIGPVVDLKELLPIDVLTDCDSGGDQFVTVGRPAIDSTWRELGLVLQLLYWHLFNQRTV